MTVAKNKLILFCLIIFVASAVEVLFTSAVLANDEMRSSPLFVTSRPVEHQFTRVATGYGAISQDRRHVAAYFSSGDTMKIKIGEAARVELLDSANKSEFMQGLVSGILRNADPKTGQSVVTITMMKKANVPSRTYASIDITLSSRMSLAVPTTAVIVAAGKFLVFKQDEKGDFDKTKVTVGSQEPDFTEIKNGLSVSDTVLVQGALEWYQNLMGGGSNDDDRGDD